MQYICLKQKFTLNVFIGNTLPSTFSGHILEVKYKHSANLLFLKCTQSKIVTVQLYLSLRFYQTGFYVPFKIEAV